MFNLTKDNRVEPIRIKLQKNLQLPYNSIYNLGLVELKTLKTYIEINLANGFIQLLKSSVGTFIFFFKKANGTFCLYISYQDLNNLTIKNYYLLLLINKSLNQLGQAKKFTQLNLINDYYLIKI